MKSRSAAQDTVGEIAGKRHFAVEHRRALLNALQKFLVGEPDEIFETYGNELFSIVNLKGQLGSRRRVGIAIRDVGEDAQIAEAARGSLEIVFSNRCPELQTTGREDGIVGVALTSCDLEGNQLPVRRRQMIERLSRG